jgi:hypothetical protein
MGSALIVIIVLALAAWLIVRVVARVRVTIALVKERAEILWIGIAVLVAVLFAAYR